MDKIEIAEMLGVTTRQHLEKVIAGNGNFSYKVARKAVAIFGGTLGIWMEKGHAEERKKLFDEFTTKTKRIAA